MKDTLHDSHGLPLGHPDNPESQVKLKKTLRSVKLIASVIFILMLIGLATALFDQ